jgi:hypothetical protein
LSRTCTCVRILEERLNLTIQSKEDKNSINSDDNNINNLNIYDFFDEDAIKTIFENSLGIPKLILDISSKALSLLKSMIIGSSSTTPKQSLLQQEQKMNRKVSNKIAIQACRQIKCQQAKMEYGNLSDIKKEIIYKIMYKERSATEIAAQIRKDRTTVSRHLNE